jgi:hypothetical protein
LKKWVVRPVVEEAGCQACEKISLGERVYWEVVFFQRESNTSYRALRIPDPAYFLRPREGGEASMDCVFEGVYSQVEQACGE